MVGAADSAGYTDGLQNSPEVPACWQRRTVHIGMGPVYMIIERLKMKV